MIKINLLKSFSANTGDAAKATDGSQGGQSEVIEVLKRVLVLLLGPIAFYFYEQYNLPDVQTGLTRANQELSELQQFNESKKNLAEDIKKYEIEQSRFEAQMDFINKIASDKVNEYQLFLHIKKSTPETIWIKKIELNNKIVTITAESDQNSEVQKYQQRLSEVDFIKNLIILNQSVANNFLDTGISITQFTVRATLGTAAGVDK